MIFNLQRLFHTIARLDETVGEPPWPLQVWNPETQTWEDVVGSGGIAGVESISSPLVCARRPIGVLGDYVSTASGELVVTDSGEPMTLGALRVYEVPEFILTAEGDVIGVAGR